MGDRMTPMKIEQGLRKAVIAGIFLIPFIPLIVADFLFFPFITGKNFAFRILVELVFGAWVLLALYNPLYRPRFSWLLAAIAAFVGIVAVADIFGENPMKSIWSNFERMEGLVTLIHLFAYFLVASTVLHTEKLWNWFWNTSVGVSVFLGMYGLLQLAGKITINQGGVRLDATFGNATYLAVYMLFHLFIVAMLLWQRRDDRMFRLLYSGIMILQIVMLYYTATRGTILGFLGGAMLSALLVGLFAKGSKAVRKISLGILATVVLVVGGFFLVKDAAFVKESPVLSRFADISVTETTVSARFMVWNMAWQGVKERPVLGWGQENFNFVFNKYYDPNMYTQEQWFDRVHNIVFDWLIAAGFLGLLAYGLLFLATLYYLWRRQSRFSITEKSIVTGLLAGYTFHNLFVFDNVVSYIFFFTVMAYVYVMSQEKEEIKDSKTAPALDHGVILRLYAPLLIILMLFSLYFFNTKGIGAATSLLDAIAVQPGTDAQLDAFKKALSYHSFGDQEAREQLAQLATRIAGSNLPVEMKQKYLTLGGEEMQRQVTDVPNDARTQIFFATLLDSFGQYGAAHPYAKRARELSPTKQTILFQVGLNALNRGDSEEALAIFKEAYELAPSYNQAAIFYAVGAIRTGNQSLANTILMTHFGSTIVDDDRLQQAYYNAGYLDKVLGIWKLRVEKEPQNPQMHLGLAAAYLELNRREDSIAEIQKTIELDPNFKKDGEYLIGEIRAGRNPR